MSETVFIGIIIAVFSFIGYDTGYDAGYKDMRQEAVKQGYAQYNPQTTEFEWIPQLENGTDQ